MSRFFSFLVITSCMLDVIESIIHFQVPRYNIVHNLVYDFNFIAAPYEAMIATVSSISSISACV